MTLEERYNRLRATPSSINEHLEVLRAYASRCESVAEFGVDIGQSTTALLMGQPVKLLSIDVVRRIELNELITDIEFSHLSDGFRCLVGKTWWVFGLDDSRTITLPEVDLLFIDSARCYDQMSAELTRHHVSVRKWIACHDTITFWAWGEAGEPQLGIGPALTEFLAEHNEWTQREHYTNNNGLMILERTNG